MVSIIEGENQKKDSFVCFIDDNDQKTGGYFKIIEITDRYIKFKTDKNKITIPLYRVIKIKEPL